MTKLIRQEASKSLAEPSAATVSHRRPKGRKAHIIRVATEAFSTQGYHTANLGAIAAQVGISAPALYRHYPSKYAIFAAAARNLSQQMVDCSDFVDALSDEELAADPAAVLDRVVDAVIEVALANRRSGGLYRWQARYLRPADRAALLSQLQLANRRIQRPLLALRPSLNSEQRWMLSAGLFSAIGSILDHQIDLPTDDMRTVLAGAASALLSARLELPGNEPVERPPVWRVFDSDADADEAILREAMMLFGRQGYAATSIAQIAKAVHVSTATIYLSFASKRDILAVGLQHAAKRVADELAAVADVSAEPRVALTELIEAYVAIWLANPELTSIYYTEPIYLTIDEQAKLRGVQRSGIDLWTGLLESARPELGATQARVLVHAAMALVVHLSRLATYDQPAGAEQRTEPSALLQAGVCEFMLRTLFGSDQ